MSKESPHFNTLPIINGYQLFDSKVNAQKTLRPEIFYILDQKVNKIQRFTNLGLSPESIEKETVENHTLKMLARTYNLSGCKEIIGLIRETVAIHDLPETIQLIRSGKTADTTAPVKASSSTLDQQIEISEEQMAREIFDIDELQLYLDFSQAGEFLKGKSDNLPTEAGLISKILDKVDADLSYHRAAIICRVNGDKLDKKGQSLGFEKFITFSDRLDSLKGTKLADTRILCQNLLNKTMLSIKEMWSEVSTNEIPSTIKEYLVNLQIHPLL